MKQALQQVQAEQVRTAVLARVMAAQMGALRALCDTPEDALDVLVAMATSIAVDVGVPLERLKGDLVTDFERRAAAKAASERKIVTLAEGITPGV